MDAFQPHLRFHAAGRGGWLLVMERFLGGDEVDFLADGIVIRGDEEFRLGPGFGGELVVPDKRGQGENGEQRTDPGTKVCQDRPADEGNDQGRRDQRPRKTRENTELLETAARDPRSCQHQADYAAGNRRGRAETKNPQQNSANNLPQAHILAPCNTAIFSEPGNGAILGCVHVAPRRRRCPARKKSCVATLFSMPHAELWLIGAACNNKLEEWTLPVERAEVV